MNGCSVVLLTRLDHAAANCGENPDGREGLKPAVDGGVDASDEPPSPSGAPAGTTVLAVSGELRCAAGVCELDAT